MVNDPLADMLSQLNNAALAGQRQVMIPASRLKLAVLEILKTEGYIKTVTRRQRKNKPYLYCELSVDKSGRPKLNVIRRVSKPSRRVYHRAGDLKPVKGKTGLSVVSTSAGLKTNWQAKQAGIGGEVLCQVW